VTSAADPDASTFTTADVPTPNRKTTEITIGRETYTAQEPKNNVWKQAHFLLRRNELGKVAGERLDAGGPLAAGERAALERRVAEIPDEQEIDEILVEGRTLPDGRVVGGFLRCCLTPTDFRKILLELDDQATELDTEHLYEAALKLFVEFEKSFVTRMEAINLRTPSIEDEAAPKGRHAAGSPRS
jgi:hypothetical protein